MKYFPIVIAIFLSACIPEEYTVGGEIEGTMKVEIDFGLPEALVVLTPFANMGITIPLAVPDEEFVYCEDITCLSAGQFREAALFMLKYPVSE